METTGAARKKFSLDVDIKSLGEVKTMGMVMVPQELVRDVTKYAVIDEKWWYWSDEGASRYMTLKKNQQYGLFSRSLALLRYCMPDITRMVVAQFTDWGLQGSSEPVDFIPLGTGDFEKEGLALQAYMRSHEKISRMPVRTVPVDMSLPLMYRAMTAASKSFKNRLSGGTLKLEPHLGDYTSFTKDDFGGSNFRFYTALATVHNAKFPDILDTYRRLMTDKSVLLLDMDAIDEHDDTFVLSSYNNPPVWMMLYTSLGLLQKGGVEGGAILDDDGSIIGDMSDYARCTHEGGTIEPEFVTVADMDDFVQKNGLPSTVPSKLRISPDPLDKTIAVLYHPKNHSYPHPIVLGYTTRFNRAAFPKKLENAGFEIIASWFNPDIGTNSLYLVKPEGT